MAGCPRSRLVRYGAATLIVTTALLLRWSLWPVLGPEIPFLLLWPAVLVAAWYGGYGPGLLATVLAAFAVDRLFLSPVGLWKPADAVGLTLFVLLGASISLVTSRLRQAGRQIAEQREWLRSTLASLGDAVVATDAAGRVSFLNAVAQSLTGWKQSDAAGRPVEEVVRLLGEADEAPLDNPARRALQEGEAVAAGPSLLVARGGSRLPVEVSVAPIRREGGAALGTVLVFRDISERRRMEEELRRRAAELAEADRRKDHFLAVLGHELRTPLSSIRNAGEILKLLARGDETLRQTAGVVDRQGRQLARLVDDLLDVSRFTRGKLRLQRERVELADVLERAVECSRPLLESRRHELIEELPRGPVWVDADPARLAQVVSNLLNNAAKYTPEHGRIWLSAGVEAGEVVVRVRDNGIGITPEMLPHLFKPFSQADRALPHAQGGLGLGLTLVKDLAELHGGQVLAHSDGPGKGSEFVVRLPVVAEPPSGQAPARRPRAADAAVRSA